MRPRLDDEAAFDHRRLLAAYRAGSRWERTHVAIRWRSCPFDQVLAELPREGAVLDVGCGHGLLAIAAALARPGCSVVGTDVDGPKLDLARAAASAAGVEDRVSFEVGDAGALPPGSWSAIVAVDVLYLLPYDAQRDLIVRAAASLVRGGRLVLKETSRHPRWKSAWSRAQELLAVRVLRLTAGTSLHFATPESIERWMRDAGLAVERRGVDAGYLHPHHLFVGGAT